MENLTDFGETANLDTTPVNPLFQQPYPPKSPQQAPTSDTNPQIDRRIRKKLAMFLYTCVHVYVVYCFSFHVQKR